SRSSGPSAPSGSRESFRRQTRSRMCSAQGTCFMLGPFRMGRLLGETWSKTRLLWRKLGSAVFPCNKYVYLGKVGIITEPLLMKSIQSQVISAGDKPDFTAAFLPHYPSKRRLRKTGRGFHLPHLWQYYLRGINLC